MSEWICLGHISLIWIAEVWSITAEGIEQHYLLIAGSPRAPEGGEDA
jgi:hypothetical protein